MNSNLLQFSLLVAVISVGWILLLKTFLLVIHTPQRREAVAELDHRHVQLSYALRDPSALSAGQKAMQLLEHTLGPEGWADFKSKGFIAVPSRRRSYRTYLIYPPHGGVLLQELGRVIGSLCVYCLDESLPYGDQMVTLYLITKYHEDYLMTVGNFTDHR